MSKDQTPEEFAAAVVSEIKAEMGRRGMSSRALARAIGQNPQYVTSRLNGGNPRTGELVPLTIRDVYAITGALDIDAADLIERAEDGGAALPKVNE